MEVFGELNNAFLENSPSGSAAQQGRATGGANVASEVDATLTDLPAAYVGNGSVADRLASAREVQSVFNKLNYLLAGAAVAKTSGYIYPDSTDLSYSANIAEASGLLTLTGDTSFVEDYLAEYTANSGELIDVTQDDGTYGVIIGVSAGISTPYTVNSTTIADRDTLITMGSTFDAGGTLAAAAAAPNTYATIADLPVLSGLNTLKGELSVDGGSTIEASATIGTHLLNGTLPHDVVGKTGDTSNKPIIKYTLVSNAVTAAEIVYPSDSALNVTIDPVDLGDLQYKVTASFRKVNSGLTSLFIPTNRMFAISVDTTKYVTV